MATWSAHRSPPPDLRLWRIFSPSFSPRDKPKLCCIKHGFRGKELGGGQVQAKLGKGEDAVRLPLMDPCCIIPPLALSKERGSMGRRAKRASSDRRMASSDAEVAELVARVVKDPMVEVDPVTLALHLSNANKGVATSTNLSKSVAVSSRLPPFSLNFRGLNALAYSAAGASFVMVIAAVVQSLRNHSKSVVSGCAETSFPNPVREACVEEVFEASEARLASESNVSDVMLNGISKVAAYAGKNERTDAILTSEDASKDKNLGRGARPAVSHSFQSGPAANMMPPASFAYLRNEDQPSHTGRIVLPDNLIDETQVADYVVNHEDTFLANQLLGENLQVTNTEMPDYMSSSNSVIVSSVMAEEVQIVAEEQDLRIETAAKSDGEGSALQPAHGDDPHTPHNSNISEASMHAFPSLGSTHKCDTCEGDLHAADKRKLDARKTLQAAAPALTIGAGALGVFSGIDGGLEMVGIAAAASFISYELLWAQTREQLWQELRRVRDHEELIRFLKARNILQD